MSLPTPSPPQPHEGGTDSNKQAQADSARSAPGWDLISTIPIESGRNRLTAAVNEHRLQEKPTQPVGSWELAAASETRGNSSALDQRGTDDAVDGAEGGRSLMHPSHEIASRSLVCGRLVVGSAEKP